MNPTDTSTDSPHFFYRKWSGATNENVNFDVRVLNNNWTECDYKIGQAHSVSLIWNHKYDLRPKLHDTKFNYYFIVKPFWKLRIQSITMFYWSSRRFAKNWWKQKGSYISLCIWNRCNIKHNWCNLKQMMWFRTWMTWFKTDVIWRRKWCDLWINHTAEGQSDCRDHHWFQNGYNKGLKLL